MYVCLYVCIYNDKLINNCHSAKLLDTCNKVNAL